MPVANARVTLVGMEFLSFLRRKQSLSSAPKFKGPVRKEKFIAATRVTNRHFERFEAEGLFRTRYENYQDLVENPAEFVKRTMKPSLASWPPQLPALDHRLEQEYARSGRNLEIAARILEPFRFQALGERWEDVVMLARPSAMLVPGGAGPRWRQPAWRPARRAS